MKNSNSTLEFIKSNLIKISDQEYFGDEYRDCISNSSMKYINPSQDGSPYEYKYVNHKMDAGFLDLGTILHSIILEKHIPQFIIGDIPTGKMYDIIKFALDSKIDIYESFNELANQFVYYKSNGALLKKNFDKYKDYYEYKKSSPEDTFYINDKTYEKVKIVIDRADIIRRDHLYEFNEFDSFCPYQIFNEMTILASFNYNNNYTKEVNTLLNVKAKIDNYIINPLDKTITLNDLKTTYKKVEEFKDSFEKYHYARQFSFYLYLLKKTLNLDDYKIKAKVVVVSTTSLDCDSFYISQEDIESGFLEWSDCLKRIGFHESYGYDLLIENIW